MLKERVFHNIMLVNMAKFLKIPIEQEPGEYILYKNERDRIHKKEYFRGDPNATYKKLLEIEEGRAKSDRAKNDKLP